MKLPALALLCLTRQTESFLNAPQCLHPLSTSSVAAFTASTSASASASRRWRRRASLAPSMAHVIKEIAPVKALMLTTRWKSDAEDLNALGYTPKDDTYTIVQKSSASDVLTEMQRLANMLSLLGKTEGGLTPDHAAYDQLNGMKVVCALSTDQNEGTAIAFYKEAANDGATAQIDYCMGNIALGTNENAEEVLVRKIVDEARAGGVAKRVTVRGRVAPSGTTYLPAFCEAMGFAKVDPQPSDDPHLLYELQL